MTDYLLYGLVSLGCTALCSLMLGFLFRKRLRQKRWDRNLSTKDFLPCLLAVAIGLLLGQAIDLLIFDPMIDGTNNTVVKAVSDAIQAAASFWTFIWYKTRNK